MLDATEVNPRSFYFCATWLEAKKSRSSFVFPLHLACTRIWFLLQMCVAVLHVFCFLHLFPTGVVGCSAAWAKALREQQTVLRLSEQRPSDASGKSGTGFAELRVESVSLTWKWAKWRSGRSLNIVVQNSFGVHTQIQLAPTGIHHVPGKGSIKRYKSHVSVRGQSHFTPLYTCHISLLQGCFPWISYSN